VLNSCLPVILVGVDLWEYYERVEHLIVALRNGGHFVEAERVEVAIRGGATSGEILGRLAGALPDVANSVPSYRIEVEALVGWAESALRPR
jgi:hypothetical protein